MQSELEKVAWFQYFALLLIKKKTKVCKQQKIGGFEYFGDFDVVNKLDVRFHSWLQCINCKTKKKHKALKSGSVSRIHQPIDNTPSRDKMRTMRNWWKETFKDLEKSGWDLGLANINRDTNIEELLPSSAGITVPFFYVGSRGSMAAMHTEDANLLSWFEAQQGWLKILIKPNVTTLFDPHQTFLGGVYI